MYLIRQCSSGGCSFLGFVCCKKTQNMGRYCLAVIFQREMPAIKQVQFRLGNISLESLCPFHREKWIILSPDNQSRRLVFPEIRLPFRVKGHVGRIVVEQGKLNFIVARAIEKELIEGISIRTYFGDVFHSVCVLEVGRL